MATTPCKPLKGEVLLANGSRVLFEALKWEFFYPSEFNSGCYRIKAEECPNDQQDNIHIDIDGKMLSQKIREMQKQSIKINVELTEEGKRAVKEAVLGKAESEHSKPPVGSCETLLEDARKLLERYAEAYPWEYEINGTKDHLVERIEYLKKQETYSFVDAICKARMQQGYSLPLVITNSELVIRLRCQPTGEPTHYIVFKNKECIGVCEHPSVIMYSYSQDLSKGWYPASSEETSWARAQSLSHILSEQEKKQEESTALFDVIGRAVLQHSGKRFEAQNSKGFVLAVYRVIDNNWSLVSADEKPVEINITKDGLQALANKHKIDLSKGWRMVNISGVRG